MGRKSSFRNTKLCIKEVIKHQFSILIISFKIYQKKELVNFQTLFAQNTGKFFFFLNKKRFLLYKGWSLTIESFQVKSTEKMKSCSITFRKFNGVQKQKLLENYHTNRKKQTIVPNTYMVQTLHPMKETMNFRNKSFIIFTIKINV